jgi:hypothetical protein
MKRVNGVLPLNRFRRLPAISAGLVALAISCQLQAAPGDSATGTEQSPMQTPEEVLGGYDYLQIAGSAFVPFASNAQFAYSGNGCINSSGSGENRFAHKLVLPAGSLIKYLRLYYYDDSTSSITAFFTTYDAAGNFSQLTSVGSLDSGTYGSNLSSELSYEINPASSPVNVVVNLGSDTTSALRFCGVRIAYLRPFFDRIFADGFD